MRQMSFLDEGLCSGRLVTLFADESSWRCTKCDWSGWPRQIVDPRTGVILRQDPHPYEWYPHLHGGQADPRGDIPLPQER